MAENGSVYVGGTEVLMTEKKVRDWMRELKV